MTREVKTQLTFTCSESTIGTLEKGVRYIQRLTIKTTERCHMCIMGVRNVSFSEYSAYVLNEKASP